MHTAMAGTVEDECEKGAEEWSAPPSDCACGAVTPTKARKPGRSLPWATNLGCADCWALAAKPGNCAITGEVAVIIFLAKQAGRDSRDRLASRLASEHGITAKAVRDIWSLRTWRRATEPYWAPADHKRCKKPCTSVAPQQVAPSAQGGASVSCRPPGRTQRHGSAGNTAPGQGDSQARGEVLQHTGRDLSAAAMSDRRGSCMHALHVTNATRIQVRNLVD